MASEKWTFRGALGEKRVGRLETPRDGGDPDAVALFAHCFTCSKDLKAAAEYLEAEAGAPDLLVGHSLGSAPVLQAASRVPSSVAVATIGAPADPGHVVRHFDGELEEILEREEAEVTVAGRSFTIRRQFVEDLRETRMKATVGELDRALLLFHAPMDAIVGVDNAARIYEWARHPKSFVSLAGVDHLLSDEADSSYVGRMLATWAGRYL